MVIHLGVSPTELKGPSFGVGGIHRIGLFLDIPALAIMQNMYHTIFNIAPY